MRVVEDVHMGRDELVRSLTVRCGQQPTSRVPRGEVMSVRGSTVPLKASYTFV